jgi:hypothetical protein
MARENSATARYRPLTREADRESGSPVQNSGTNLYGRRPAVATSIPSAVLMAAWLDLRLHRENRSERPLGAYINL